ncbi:hypothetical protein [Bacillus thuringiensis]|uniref:hypothetical protein n=1 Tax=Bacillus thuringiensis TaxID=1428 RepID=UPI000BFD4EAC|nr:hypothetical protein [Bacillus thuringiensis]PGT90128.1 hypothetical protein COD17_10285 [Bacillus thuringiensis]
MKISEMVLNLLEMENEYEVIISDTDNGLVAYKGVVKGKTNRGVRLEAYETDGEKGEGSIWIVWDDIVEVNKVEIA